MYPYKDIPLTPAIIQELTIELFNGQLVQRQTIVNDVSHTHLVQGGKASDAQSMTSSVKKALATLLQRGQAENPSYGLWRIKAVQPPNVAPSDQGDSHLLLASIGETEIIEIPLAPTLTVEQTLGEGPGAVYLYYLPTYRLRAQERGETIWPCKIGRTERDPLERILSQAATALPERPTVAIVLRTSTPLPWEAAIHGALTIRGLRMKESPGTEWFLTSPDDVLALMQAIDPNLGRNHAQNLAVNDGRKRG